MRHPSIYPTIVLRSAIYSLSIIFFSPFASDARTDELPLALYEQCQKREGRFACYAHPSKHDVKIYAEPNTSSHIISDAPIASTIFLIETKESTNNPGWLPVYTLNNNQGALAWVLSESVVPVTSLRPVIKCWPLKMISWSEPGFGDYEGGDFVIRFSPDGTLISDYPVKERHIVYYADSIFRIRRQPSKGNQDHRVPPFFDPVFKLDSASGEVLSSPAAEDLAFEIRSPESLTDCDQTPKVATETGVDFKF